MFSEPVSAEAAWGYSLLAAVIPTVLYVALIWWTDRYEKEPVWLLAAAFIWGALPAVVLAVVGESILEPTPELVGTALGRRLVSATVVAPVVEEIAKGAAILFIFWRFREEFDGVLDGIIYGALVGFGFAMTENVFYLSAQLEYSGWVGFGILTFLRTILFGFNHAFFSAFIGAGLGYARGGSRKGARWTAPFVGLLFAIGFHALHNFGATVGGGDIVGIAASAVLDGGGLLLIVIILFLAVRQERAWIREELQAEVGILISSEEFRIALSPWTRWTTRVRAASTHGLFGSRKVGKFYQSVAELAFRLHRYRHGRASKKDLRAIPELREKIAKLGAEIHA